MNIPVMIDSHSFGRYTAKAAAKSVAGRGNPEFIRAHNRAFAVFLCVMHCHIRIMVGRAGQPQGWPGSLMTGISTPVRLTTSLVVESLGGELKHSSEAAIMATIPAIAQPKITVINGHAITTSLAIAEHFSKHHKNVLQKIQSLECSPEFNRLNFKPVEYTDAKGERRPAYQITRDGFAFLAMGFTGKRAAQFKEAYITAFNHMEKALGGEVCRSGAAHNAHVAYTHMSEIHRVWLASLYPMLLASKSPIASSLYDRIKDCAALTKLVDISLSKDKGAA